MIRKRLWQPRFSVGARFAAHGLEGIYLLTIDAVAVQPGLYLVTERSPDSDPGSVRDYFIGEKILERLLPVSGESYGEHPSVAALGGLEVSTAAGRDGRLSEPRKAVDHRGALCRARRLSLHHRGRAAARAELVRRREYAPRAPRLPRSRAATGGARSLVVRCAGFSLMLCGGGAFALALEASLSSASALIGLLGYLGVAFGLSLALSRPPSEATLSYQARRHPL